MNDWKDCLGMVYSTNPDFEYERQTHPDVETPEPERQRLHIAFERKHRGGKQVTIVGGFVGSQDDLAALAKTLKTRLGVGGAAKEGEIIIQGDVRTKVTELLRKLGYKLFLFLFLFFIPQAKAQYYSWGGDAANVSWRRLDNGAVNLVYPKYFEENARRTMWYLDTIRPHIGFGFTRPAMRTPVILHTQNMMVNGMVMWAPKRIELLSAPVSSYSEPWLKQLVIHEYRHNVQYNNLRQGTNKVLTWLFGEQLAFLGIGQFSIYLLEGDVTMMETEASAFGRGLQPSWTMHYRAVNGAAGDSVELKPNGKPWRAKNRQKGIVGSRDFTGDYWFSGSFRDNVPDHYHTGYQMVRWSYNHSGRFVLDDAARYVARNPQFIVPLRISLKKQLGMTLTGLFRNTFADLDTHWSGLAKVSDSAAKIPTPWRSYTTWQSPEWLTDSTLVAFKADLDRTNRIVKVNANTGKEKHLAYTGVISSGPTLSEGKLWWTEYRASVLYPQKVNSRLVSYDIATDQKQVHRVGKNRQILSPTMTSDSLAWIEYDYTGRFSIVRRDGRKDLERTDFPLGTEVNSLAWDDKTAALYFIGLDDGGMFLGKSNDDSFERLTPSRHITISDLRAKDGMLYFGSIASGKDEAHSYDLSTGTEYQLSHSAYGAFQPSANDDGARIALTVYDRNGYHLAVQNAAEKTVQPSRELPLNIVNPDWRRWSIPRMDSLVYTPTEAERSKAEIKPRRFNKMLKLFRPHSWLPINFYPPGAIQEMDLTLTLGATVMSQNLLSDMTSWLGYGWSGRGGHLLRGGLSYSGLGPTIDFGFQWGGGLETRYSNIGKGVYDRQKYYSLDAGLSLPMTVGSGYWNSRLTPRVDFMFTNGLFISQTKGSMARGVGRLGFSFAYQGMSRRAKKEFLPRWGFAARVGYMLNPLNFNDFRQLFSAYVDTYLPGVVRPHSLHLRLSWQQSTGRGSLSFTGKELAPRGTLAAFSTTRWASGSVDYQLPVWYPEGGISGVLYFKRVRVNLFVDYARWQGERGERWRPLYSYGGDLILDLSPFRTPGNTNFALRLTFAKPSDRRGIFFGFGAEMPI